MLAARRMRAGNAGDVAAVAAPAAAASTDAWHRSSRNEESSFSSLLFSFDRGLAISIVYDSPISSRNLDEIMILRSEFRCFAGSFFSLSFSSSLNFVFRILRSEPLDGIEFVVDENETVAGLIYPRDAVSFDRERGKEERIKAHRRVDATSSSLVVRSARRCTR